MDLPISDFRSQIDPTQRAAQIRNPPAFSLIEILIVVAMLSVIILGLVAMFGQTQRAFRAGMTQTDVLQAGRMATDLIVREMEQMTPAHLPVMGLLPNYSTNIQPNFSTWLSGNQPLVQPLPGSTIPRTNLLEEMFFLTRYNQEWIGIGYFVRTNNPASRFLGIPLVVRPPATTTVGAGTLYRFETNAHVLSVRTPAQMYQEFLAATVDESRASKIMDGVIHFRLRAYNTTGNLIVTNRDVSASGNQTNNTDIRVSTVAPGEVGQYLFYSNVVPASVELEIGILEDRAWERFKSLADPAGKYRYLTNQAGRVHLFRQRIPIRSVDPLAYQ